MRRLLLSAMLAALPVIAPPSAQASAVVIWPVDPTIAAGEQATALWLENKGDAPVTLQVRTFTWSQPAGEDRLDAQATVVASPPIATVAPGERQLVRIIRRAPDSVPEKAYRLLVDELPPPPPSDADGAPQARLAVQMRYSIPLFTFAGARPASRLESSIGAGAQGRTLTIRNTGAAHARLTDLKLVSGSREVLIRAGLAGYVLPGATVTFALGQGESGTVRATVNGVDQVLGTTA